MRWTGMGNSNSHRDDHDEHGEWGILNNNGGKCPWSTGRRFQVCSRLYRLVPVETPNGGPRSLHDTQTPLAPRPHDTPLGRGGMTFDSIAL